MSAEPTPGLDVDQTHQSEYGTFGVVLESGNDSAGNRAAPASGGGLIRWLRKHSCPEPDAMMLPSRHYVSDHTRFMRELLEQQPQLAQHQREGRAIWWDKTPQALVERRRMDEGRVPQQPYVYQSGK